MDDHRKYYNFIPLAIDQLLKSADDSTKFEKYYIQLSAVVPKYGLSLHDFTAILDLVIDPHSTFKNSQKNKLLTLFHCRELLDFSCVLKILSVFKVSSYYDRKSTVYVISQNIQKKLSTFLIRNFTNIRWDNRFLKLLNLVFDLLSIGYLRSSIGLFLIYLLNMTFEIDPRFKKGFFFTAKKFNTVIEFYDVDQKSSLPLLLYFAECLHSMNRGDLYDVIYSKYKLIISDLRIPKDPFGKVNVNQINQIAKMKDMSEQSTEDQIIFENNLRTYIQIVTSLNIAPISGLTNNSTRKRKYLEDENFTNIINNIGLHKIFSPAHLASEMDSEITRWNSSIIFLLKYVSTLDLSELVVSESSNVLTTDELLFSFYTPIITILASINPDKLNKSILSVLQIQDNALKLSSDMHWIFKGITNLYKLYPELELIECLADIIAGNIRTVFKGTEKEKHQALNTAELLQFLESNQSKYEEVLTNIIDSTFKSNDSNMMKGVVLLATNWVSDVDSFYQLLELVLSKINYSNRVLLNEFMNLVTLIHSIPYSSIDMTKLVLKSDIMAMVFFSNDLYNINLLLQHVTYCKKYFADYGLRKIENSEGDENYKQLKSIKELHNSYIMDICNFLWRNKAYDIEDISSGRFFGFPVAFVEKLQNKSMDLVHLPATRALFEVVRNNEYDVDNTDDDKKKMAVFRVLREESYGGISGFLQNSIRGLNS